MNITNEQLRRIIKEELASVLSEGPWDEISGVTGGPGAPTGSGLGHRGNYRSGEMLAADKEFNKELGKTLRAYIKAKGKVNQPTKADLRRQKMLKQIRSEEEAARAQAKMEKQIIKDSEEFREQLQLYINGQIKRIDPGTEESFEVTPEHLKKIWDYQIKDGRSPLSVFDITGWEKGTAIALMNQVGLIPKDSKLGQILRGRKPTWQEKGKRWLKKQRQKLPVEE